MLINEETSELGTVESLNHETELKVIKVSCFDNPEIDFLKLRKADDLAQMS